MAPEQMLQFSHGVTAKSLQFSMVKIKRYSTKYSACLRPTGIIVWLFGVRLRGHGNTFLLGDRGSICLALGEGV